MTVTNTEEQSKNIDVTINIINVIEEFDSLPAVITENVNENSRFALEIPEYKDTNSYAFTGVDGDKVKLWPERGEVIFNYAPDFEIQDSYNFIMTVTSTTEQAKDVDVTISINDVSNAFIFEVLAGSIGTIEIVLNDGHHETQYDTYSFTVKRDDEVAQEFNNLGTIRYRFIPLIEAEDALTQTQRFTIIADDMDGLPAFRFNANQGDSDVKIKIIQWGDNSWQSLEEMLAPLCDEDRNSDSLFFSGLHDSPNLSRVDNASVFFAGCNLTESLSYWDVSNIKDMRAAFANTKGSTDLSQWVVSSVNDMGYMFENSSDFNSDLSLWDVSSVARMDNMFRKAKEFNSDLSLWNTSSVNSMYRTFFYAEKFNSDLSGWNVSSVNNMKSMFYTALEFNSDISLWDTSSVENMDYMFYDAASFDQDITGGNGIGWDVTKVTTCTDFKLGAILSEANTPTFTNCSM